MADIDVHLVVVAHISDQADDRLLLDAVRAQTVEDLAGLLRALRRRHARRQGRRELPYRTLAAMTGWSHTAVAEYLTGRTLPPTDRFDILVDLLGAGPAERGALATARDRVDERRRASTSASTLDGTQSLAPRQLPPAVRHFAGRRAELAHLAELDGDGLVVTITGGAGIGKTALALHWAHRQAARYPDGQLYLNLRGFDLDGPAVQPVEALHEFLAALEVPDAPPVGLEALAARLRSALAGRRVLILLDNARDSAQVRPLLPGMPTCLTIVTGRNQLTGLVAAEGAHPLTLDLLGHDDAAELLRRHIGAERCRAEPAAVAGIIEACARLPLALAVVGARAATSPRTPLAELADQVRGEHHRLDTLSGDEPDLGLRAAFTCSYRALSPDAARLFRLLGLHPGPSVSVAAAAGLAGLSIAETRRQLAELLRTNLIGRGAGERYALHDLLRLYAAEQARFGESQQHLDEATHRMLDHYLRTAVAAQHLLEASRAADETEQALAWFAAEHRVLLGAMDCAGNDRTVVDLATATATFLDRRGHWHSLVSSQQAALAAAGRLGDLAAQALAHRHLARGFTRIGRYEAAHNHLGQALELYRRCDDPAALGHTHLNLSLTCERQGRYAEALEHGRTAFELCVKAGDRSGQGRALNVVGWYLALLGKHSEALPYCRRALPLLDEAADTTGQATTWDSLGFAHFHLGQFQEAARCHQRAVELFREAGDRHIEGLALDHLGDSLHSCGDRDEARAAWRQALEILDSLRHPDAEPIRAKLFQASP